MRSRRLLSGLLVTASLGLVAPSATPAWSTGAWSARSIANLDLTDVRFANASTGWAVGAGGAVFRTTDGGATWVRQSSGTSQNLNGIDVVSADRAWVVGAASTIRTTTNGGQSWTAQPAPANATLLDVDFVDATHGWAVGATAGLANLVLATTDGGATWTQQAAPAGMGLVGVSFADRTHGFAVGYFDMAYRTEDGGLTWTPMAVKAETFEGTTTDSFYAVVRSSATEGLLGGFRGEIYRTQDGGLTWTLAGELGQQVHGLSTSGAAAFAAGHAGAVARSDDGGATWTTASSGTTANLKGVSAVSATRAFAVGTFGFLARFDALAQTSPLELGLIPGTCGALPIPWEHADAGTILSALALDVDADGRTEIVAASARGVRALRPFEDTADATIWNRPLQSPISFVRTAELDGDALPELVAATGQGQSARTGVLALDAEDGSVIWSRQLPGATRMLRVADLDRDGLDDAATVSTTRDLRLLSGIDGHDLRDPTALPALAVDLALGDLDRDGVPEAVTPLSNGRAIVFDGATGEIRWSYDADGDFRTAKTGDLTGDGTPDVILGGTGLPGSVTPGRGDDAVPVGSQKGALIVALDGRDGSRLWDYGQNNPFMHFDAVALGDLTGDGTPDVVGHAAKLDGSHLLALDGRGRRVEGASTGEPLALWRHSTALGVDPIQQVNSADALELADVDADGRPDAITAQVSGNIFAVSGRPPAPSSDLSETGRPPVAPRIWVRSRAWQAYQASPVTIDGRNHLLTLFADGLLSLRAPGTGEVEWSYDGGVFPSVATGDLDGDGRDEIAVGTGAGRVFGLDANGEALNRNDAYLTDRVVDVAVTNADGDAPLEIAAAAIDGMLAVVDPRTSLVLWTATGLGEPRAVAAGGGVIVVADAAGMVRGFDAITGAPAWEFDAVEALNDVIYVPSAGLFAAASDTGALHLLDRAGAEQARGSAETWMGRLATGDVDGDGDDEVVAASGFTFRAYDTDGSQLWMVPAPNVAYDVGTGDMDGDGRSDVAAAALGRDFGIGSDGEELWDLEAAHPGGAAVVDVDGDGAREALIGRHQLFGGGQLRAVRPDGRVVVDCVPGEMPAAIRTLERDGDPTTEAVVTTREGVISLVDAG